MQVEFLIQKKDSNLIDSFLESFSKKPKKVYMFLGDLKENGFRIIEEEFIDTDIKLFMAVGVNKKNTTRNMLESILEYTKYAYYYINNNEIEFNSNICIFEYEKEASIYVASASFSESEIKENISFYNKIIVDLKNEEDKKEYKNIIKKLTKSLEELEFEKLTKEKINELIESKEIFSTRQYTHTNVKSISELLGKSKEETPKKEMTKNEIDDVYVSNIEIPKIDLSSLDLNMDDIDISEEVELIQEKNNNKVDIELEEIKEEALSNLEELKDLSGLEDAPETSEINEEEYKIDKENEFYDETLEDMEFNEDDVLDINDMLFSKADIKLDVDVKKENDKAKKSSKIIEENEAEKSSGENEFDTEDEILQVKKLNLNNVSNVIMELPNSPAKETECGKIKVPNQLQKMIPDFFELQDKGRNEEINSVSYKLRDISLEIIDAKTGEKYNDRNAKIMQKKGQSFLIFESDVIKNVKYKEKDIARVIKLSSDTYHIEIISQDMQEYKLWSKLCNQNFKAGNRKFGVM